MNVLIATATRHGSTREIAESLADELRGAGITAYVRDAGDVAGLDGYDAVILGSAVYMGAWLPDARHFAERHCAGLSERPLWLFSSGPVGGAGGPELAEPHHIAELARDLGARDHHVFAGRLDPSRLGVGERLATKLVHAPAGDYRDWDAIRAWARDIAAQLGAVLTAS